jgi:hypothetical protein
MSDPTPLLGGFGSTLLPVRDTTEKGEPLSSAGTLDKGKNAILGLLEAAINYECGDAWRSLLQQGDKTFFLRGNATGDAKPVMDIMTVTPNAQNLMERKADWPLLAVYREGEPTHQFETLKLRTSNQDWSVDYIMGPLGVDSQERYGDFVLQVLVVIEEVINQGSHPAYLDDMPVFQGVFSRIDVATTAGPGCSDVTPQEQGSGYFGGSAVLKSIERHVPQANTRIGKFPRDAFYYDEKFPGYGTATDTDNGATGTEVDPDIENISAPFDPNAGSNT